MDMAAAKEDVLTNSRRETSGEFGSDWDCGKVFMANGWKIPWFAA